MLTQGERSEPWEYMKKTLLLIATMLCCAMPIFAQNDKISYQAVVRDTETQAVTTNYNGLISLLIS